MKILINSEPTDANAVVENGGWGLELLHGVGKTFIPMDSQDDAEAAAVTMRQAIADGSGGITEVTVIEDF